MSCGSDVETHRKLLKYANDNSCYVAICDYTMFEAEYQDRPPVADLIDRLSVVYDAWVPTFFRLKGLDLANTMLIGDYYYLPLKYTNIVVPVKNEKRLVESIEFLKYQRLEGDYDGITVYYPGKTYQRSVLIDGDVALFMYGTNVDSLVQRVHDLRKDSQAHPMAEWKQELLNGHGLASTVMRASDNENGHRYVDIKATIEGDRLASSVRMYDALGKQVNWADSADFGPCDESMLQRLPDDCILSAAVNWHGKGRGAALAEELIPVPASHSALYDSLRVTVGRILDDIDGTSVAGISFRGSNVLNLGNYFTTWVSQVKPGTAQMLHNSCDNLLKVADIPYTRGFAGATEANIAGLQVKFNGNTAENLFAVHTGIGDRVETSHRMADLSDLVAYLVVDITPVGSFATALGRPVKMQMQVRGTLEGFDINATLNQEAVSTIIGTISLFYM